MSKVVLATRNAGKRDELAAILVPLGVMVLTLDDLGIVAVPDEDELEHFDTFEDNALAKARYFFSRSGLPTLADDSGLVVDALGGRPGVHSKRWSGRTDLAGRALDAANNEKLLAALSSAASRVARFVCVAAYVDGVRELARRGEVEGQILDAARGTGGFGYDPLFYSPELGRTLAEASGPDKERVSHRGRAMRALCDALIDAAEDATGH